MNVTDLKDKTAVDEITLKITKKEEPREVRGGFLKVCNCTGEDATGTVTVTLWNQDIDKVKEGDTIKITGGWAAEYQGSIQMSAGKRGNLEVISGGDAAGAKPAKDKPAKEKPSDETPEEETVE
ncbi:MAG: hypothetical protein KKG59_03560 [Nanoarchaeota archaeon]|nr:hypothetical protein [Nanoarchaeota archaeon]